MVVDANVECATGLHDLKRGLNVAAAWCRIARRMIVNEDESRRSHLESVAHDLSRIDRGLIDRTFGCRVREQSVLRVEEENPEAFDRAASHVSTKIIDQLLRRGQEWAAERSHLQAAKHDRTDGSQQINGIAVAAQSLGLRGRGGRHDAGQGAELADQPLGPDCGVRRPERAKEPIQELSAPKRFSRLRWRMVPITIRMMIG